MLDFLDLAPQAQAAQNRPRSFRTYLELDNVKASGGEVKYLFVNRRTAAAFQSFFRKAEFENCPYSIRIIDIAETREAVIGHNRLARRCIQMVYGSSIVR